MNPSPVHQDLVEKIRQHWRISPHAQVYYFHNRRAGAGSGIRTIIEQGFPVVNSEPFSIIPPLDWGAAQEGNREWSVIRNAFFHVDYVLQAWIETRDAQYLSLAADIATDWIRYNIVQNHPNRFKWSDICTGLRAHYIAFLVSNTAGLPSVDNETFLLLLVGAFSHASALMDPEQQASSNHAIFQSVGLAALSDALGAIADTLPWQQEAERLLLKIMHLQYGTEGVHMEHSPYYHGWVLERLAQVCDLPWFKSTSAIQDLIERARSNFVHFFHPDGSLSELGESSPARVNWVKTLHSSLEYAASNGKCGAAPQTSDRVFAEAGYAVMRNSFESGLGSSYLIVAAGHHSKSHKQDDDFSFEWSTLGRRIIIDAGKHSYDFTEDRYYVASRRAHNVLEIRDAPPFDAGKPVGSAFFDMRIGDGAKLCRVQRLGRDPKHKLERIFALIGDDCLLVVDSFESQQKLATHESTATQWTHFTPELSTLRAEGDGWHGKISDDCFVYVSTWTSAGNAVSEAYFGQRVPFVQGWYSPDYGRLEPNYCLGLSARGCPVLVATLISAHTDPSYSTSIQSIVLDRTRFAVEYRLGQRPGRLEWKFPDRIDLVGTTRESGDEE